MLRNKYKEHYSGVLGEESGIISKYLYSVPICYVRGRLQVHQRPSMLGNICATTITQIPWKCNLCSSHDSSILFLIYVPLFKSLYTFLNAYLRFLKSIKCMKWRNNLVFPYIIIGMAGKLSLLASAFTLVRLLPWTMCHAKSSIYIIPSYIHEK